MRRIDVRRREANDLPACADLLLKVFRVNHYPKFWPSQPMEWIANDRERFAWVAHDADGFIVGHAAIHSAENDIPTSIWCERTGLTADRLGVVARLFIDPDQQSQGLGSRLVNRVVEHLHSENRRPVLDVDAAKTSVVAYYLKLEWKVIGETDVWMPNEAPFRSVLFAGPAPTTER